MRPPTGDVLKFGKGSSLRNKETFPPFDECPDEFELDLRYYLDNGGYPIRHWCYLGEIVDCAFLGRLVIETRDITGRMSRVAFYDEYCGRKFVSGASSKKCKIGYTVAVLYATAHQFMDMSQGFRIEDSDLSNVTFIPCSLQQLYEANDKIRGPRPEKCCAEGCDKTEGLLKCSKCLFSQYCGKDHQVAHWKEHKAECKAIEALSWFHQKDWTRFRSWFSFT